MEEYIKILLEQIRLKKARPYIEKEIRNHLNDQISANLAAGMSGEMAEKFAVEDMGSPVEAGISLDRIHRPKMAWGMVILITIISVASIIFQTMLGKSTGSYASFWLHTMIGFAVMLLIYFIDYTTIAKYAKLIGAAFLIFCAFIVFSGIGTVINGSSSWLIIGSWRISLFTLMMLYVPLYGAILYHYHGSKYGGILKSLIWLLIPVFIAMRIPSITLAIILLISMLLVLSAAICKNWFQIRKIPVCTAIWIVFIAAPLFLLGASQNLYLISPYQQARLRSIFIHSDEILWFSDMLRKTLSNSQLFGASSLPFEYFSKNAIDARSTYILSYLITEYGIFSCIIVCALLVLLLTGIFYLSIKQKNQLGMLMGFGCGIVLTVNVFLNLLINLTVIPQFQSFLPFFSSGGNGILVSYILTGIILSVYRYKNVYPQHLRLPSSKWKISIIKTDQNTMFS